MARVFNVEWISIVENTDGRARNVTSGDVIIVKRIRIVQSAIHKTMMINYFCGLFSKPHLAAHVPYKSHIFLRAFF